MSEEDLFKAEIVFIKDVLEVGERNTVQLEGNPKVSHHIIKFTLSIYKEEIPLLSDV